MYGERDAWHRGDYKTSSNGVAAFDENGTQIGLVFETATPFNTPHLMEELMAWIQAQFAVSLLASTFNYRYMDRRVFGNPLISRE